MKRVLFRVETTTTLINFFSDQTGRIHWYHSAPEDFYWYTVEGKVNASCSPWPAVSSAAQTAYEQYLANLIVGKNEATFS